MIFTNAIDIIFDLIKKDGLLRTSDALQTGFSRTTLSNLVKEGRLECIAHGQYVLPDDLPDELFILQQRISKMIYFHETALFLHDMAERTPARQSVTIPSDAKLPKTFAGDIRSTM